MIAPEELRHVVEGPRAGETSTGAGLVTTRFKALDATLAVAKAKTVMETILSAPDDWPSTVEWRKRLPGWFVEACAEEPTEAETQSWLSWWRGLNAEARVVAENERRWTLDDWLYYLEPSERHWYWWDAVTKDTDEGLVTVEVLGWPTPLGAVHWLLRAAGAEVVETLDG